MMCATMRTSSSTRLQCVADNLDERILALGVAHLE